MTFRTLITYSPFLLSLLVVLGLLSTEIAFAQQATPPPTTIEGWLFGVVINFLGVFAGFAGTFLDYAINEFVIKFGDNVVNSGLGAAINSMWTVVRDFFNIIFIFGIIYIGFKMILGSDESGTRRTLIYLIIAALLVNFSLFISKFIVDFSNVLAREVAISTFAACQTVSPSGACVTFKTDEVDVAENFQRWMQLPTIFAQSATILNGATEPWAYIFGIALVLVISMFAFAAGAVLLVIRYAALSVFMILSPFMFIGWVLPQYSGVMRKYWSGFLGRAFFAPAYIVLLYFSGAVIVASFGGGGNGSKIGDLFSDPAQFASSFGAAMGPFILSSVMLIMSVQVASKLSADGAGAAMKIGNNLARRGRRTLTQPGRWAGARAVGAGAAGLERLEKSDSRRARFARGAMLAGSLGALNSRERQRLAAAGKKVKFGTAYSRADNEEYAAKQKRLVSRREQRGKDDTAIDAAQDIDINTTDKEQKKLLDEAEKAANNYIQEEIEKMDQKQRDKITRYLKANTVAKLLDSDNLSVGEKGKLQEKYKTEIEKQITANGQVITEEIVKLSGKQLEVLGADFADQYAAELSEDQMDAYKKSDVFTERQKDGFKNTRKETRKANAGDRAARQKMFYGTQYSLTDEGHMGVVPNEKPRKAGEIASLPYEAFVQGDKLTSEANRAMSADVLKQIARNANQGKPTMSDDERARLANLVLEQPSISPAVANYLTSKKGQEDFLLNISKGEEDRIKNSAEIKNSTGETLGT